MSTTKKGGKGTVKNKKDVSTAVSCQPTLNPEFLGDDLIKSLNSAYVCKNEYEKEGAVRLYNKPFQCCEMFSFLNEEKFLKELIKELNEIKFYKKNNDLYKFQQSNDFKKLKSSHTQVFREFLLNDFRSWISKATGVELLNMIDLTSSKYSYTDILLCHDDELDSRRFAFAFYLVDPSWSEKDGGSLDLFNCDERYEPTDVAKSLLPLWNKLTWFEVSELSHHQVSEILSEDKCRLSVHGWFHSKPLPRPIRYIEPQPSLLSHVEVEESLIRDWISPRYLDGTTQAEIRLKFEKRSEIGVPNFFKKEKYDAMREALQNKDLNWKHMGPLNKRNFDFLSINIEDDKDNINAEKKDDACSSEALIKQCVQLFASEAMFLILSNMTGLRLHRLIPKESNEDDDNNGDDDDSSDSSEYREEANDDDDAAGDCEEMNCDDTGASTSSEVKDLNYKDDKNKDKVADDNLSRDNDKKRTRENENIEGDCLIGSSSKKAKIDEAPTTEDEACNAKCSYEVRRWKCGCYATANHNIPSQPALDALVSFNCEDWNGEHGGFTTYIAKDEDEELLTVEPEPNSLNLVYREKDVLSFVKHINHKVLTRTDESRQTFYDVRFSYFDEP